MHRKDGNVVGAFRRWWGEVDVSDMGNGIWLEIYWFHVVEQIRYLY